MDLQKFQQQQSNMRPPLVSTNIPQIRPNQCQVFPPNSPQFLQHQIRSQNQHAALNANPVRNAMPQAQAQSQRQSFSTSEWYEGVYKKIELMKQDYMSSLLKYQEQLEQHKGGETTSRNESEKQQVAKIIEIFNSPQARISRFATAKLEEFLKKIEIICSRIQKFVCDAITKSNEQERVKNLARQITQVASGKSPEIIHSPPSNINAPQITRNTLPRTNFGPSDNNIPTIKLNTPQVFQRTLPRTNFDSSDSSMPTFLLNTPRISQNTLPRKNIGLSNPNVPTLMLKTPQISLRTNSCSSGTNTSILGKRTNQSPPLGVCTEAVASAMKTAKTLTSENQQPIEPLITAVTSMSPEALTAASPNTQEDVVVIDSPPVLAKIPNQSPAPGICSASEEIPETPMSENKRPMYIERLINAVKSISPEALYAASDDMVAETVAKDPPLAFSSSYNNTKRRRVFDVESTLVSTKPKFSGRRKLLQEIEEINRKSLETTVELDSNSYNKLGGKIVKISFAGHGFAQIFKMPYLQIPNISTRLLVPSNYPNSSPIVLDAPKEDSSLLLLGENTEDVIEKVNIRFRLSLRKLPKLYSVTEAARNWDLSVRTIFQEHSDSLRANELSSRYGNWDCITST